MLSSTELRAIPGAFAAEIGPAFDTATPVGRDAAWLRVACELAKYLLASTLIRCCRVHGLRHVCTGAAAAHALASIAFSATQDAEARR